MTILANNPSTGIGAFTAVPAGSTNGAALGTMPPGAVGARFYLGSTDSVTFTIAAKEHCVGPAAHPFFKWVVEEASFLAKPRWNFYKYLINREGGLEAWFSSLTPPDSKRFISAVELLFY